jgi:hypothetical protein
MEDTMNEYLVQQVAREQLNDRIAAARGARAARHSTGRGRRARNGGPRRAASGLGAPALSQAALSQAALSQAALSQAALSRAARPASPLTRAGLRLANDVRHPASAFRTWLDAGVL